MDGERKRRCIATFINWSGRRLQFTRVCGVICQEAIEVNSARTKKRICHVKRNGCHPFSIRSSSFLFPFCFPVL